jgi:hypothetical protein
MRPADDDDDDEYKPVWPSGLWATSQGIMRFAVREGRFAVREGKFEIREGIFAASK